MASLTIRNLDKRLMASLRVRAAGHRRSMEEEALEILRAALAEPEPPEDLAAAIRRRFAPLAGVELELPRREPIREPPDYERSCSAPNVPSGLMRPPS